MDEQCLENIKFVALVYNDFIEKSDAIVCLEGDGYSRAVQSLKLFKRGLASTVVVSGGFNNYPFSVPADKLAEYLIKEGIDANKIIIESKSQNTWRQAIEVMKLAKKNDWEKIILVASAFHQPRAYLTFLKGMEEAGLKINLFNSFARNFDWFTKTSLGKSHFELFDDEINKIREYSKKGHLVTIRDAIAYQQWKEKKSQTNG